MRREAPFAAGEFVRAPRPRSVSSGGGCREEEVALLRRLPSKLNFGDVKESRGMLESLPRAITAGDGCRLSARDQLAMRYKVSELTY